MCPGLTFADAEAPPAGESFFYLATPVGLAEGLLGFDAEIQIRANIYSCS